MSLVWVALMRKVLGVDKEWRGRRDEVRWKEAQGNNRAFARAFLTCSRGSTRPHLTWKPQSRVTRPALKSIGKHWKESIEPLGAIEPLSGDI
jgi:hypothetical protein